jgi:hypothetical protein
MDPQTVRKPQDIDRVGEPTEGTSGNTGNSGGAGARQPSPDNPWSEEGVRSDVGTGQSEAGQAPGQPDPEDAWIDRPLEADRTPPQPDETLPPSVGSDPTSSEGA